MLAHLGVGNLVAIDFDVVEETNLPRIVGATPNDIGRPKIEVAERVARQAQPGIRFEAVDGDVRDLTTAMRLRDADILFLAVDNLETRNVFNALVHQYLIPGFQIGAKVRVDQGTGEIDDIYAVARTVRPHPGGGCLHCANLIPPARLQEESLSPEERKAQRYIDSDEVPEPSVITLNALGAATAANNALMMVMGLVEEGVNLRHMIMYPREQVVGFSSVAALSRCLDCGNLGQSRLARGDGARLPCREGTVPN